MDFYNDRVEIKYMVDYVFLDKILSFFNEFGTIDDYSDNSGIYKINTYYISSWNSFTRTAKNHGHLRIRSYPFNDNIFLEEKYRIRNRVYKKRYRIDQEKKILLMNFNKFSQIERFNELNNIEFSKPLSFISDFDKLEVEYSRIAYIIEYKNLRFRATVDKDLKSSNNILLPNKCILELKVDKDFQNVSALFLRKFNLLPQKISKYKLLKNTILY
ncbi:MAG: hypothetical protein WBL93_08225 [Lutisporaceae bacterium]